MSKVRELQAKKKNLEKYLEGLRFMQSKTTDAIAKVERDLRKACEHKETSYEVGYEQRYNYDRDVDLYHCKYCDDCKTLFVIREFKFLEKPEDNRSHQRDIDLSDFLRPFYIDRISMREDIKK